MYNTIRKGWEFFRRDLLIESGYKSSFLIELAASVQPVLVFYFISKLLDGSNQFSRYGGGYFEFVLCGIALSRYFSTALFSFSTSIRRAQTSGCLEAILSSRSNPASVIVLSSTYGFTVCMLHILIIFLTGTLFLNFDISHINIVATLASLFLSGFSLCGLGIFSAAMIIILKRGDPLEWLFSGILTLVSGAYFPLDMFPDWLQKIADVIPLTHALEALRATVIKGATISDVAPQLLFMFITGVILLPLSMFAFSRAVEVGRREGSLGHH